MPNFTDLPSQPLSSFNGLEYDLGEINDPVYGRATNLHGRIPFTLPAYQRRIPSIFYEPTRLHKLVSELVPRCRNALSNLLDDEIFALLLDSSVGPLCTSMVDLDDRTIHLALLLCIQTAVLDDLVDSPDGEGSGSDETLLTYIGFLQMWGESRRKLLQPQSDGPFNIWDVIPSFHPTIQALKDIGLYTIELAQSLDQPISIEDLTKRKDFGNEAKANFLSNLALREFLKSGQSYSSTGSLEMNRFGSGNRVPVFVTMHQLNIDLGPIIPNDILFKTVLNNYVDIVIYYNAILGLPRDIRKKQEDSPLMYFVVVKKWSLQKAFDTVCELLNDAMKDFEMSSKKLVEVYPGNDGLILLLEAIRRYVDSSLLLYKFTDRYGMSDRMRFY